MRILAAWVALIVSLLVMATPAFAGEKVIETSIEAIYKNPKKFDGRLLRVRGAVDQCADFSCQLCMSETGALPGNAAQCLRPSFDKALGGTRLDAIYRFADVTVDGRYDYLCDRANYESQESKKDGAQLIEVCTDRATNFTITRVVAVHKRWPAIQGIFHWYLGGPVASAPMDWVHEIVKAYDAFERRDSDRIGEIPPGKTYVVLKQNSEDDKDPQAALCLCDGDDCTGKWPTHAGHLWLRSLADPYHCALVKQVKGEWRFPPAFE